MRVAFTLSGVHAMSCMLCSVVKRNVRLFLHNPLLLATIVGVQRVLHLQIATFEPDFTSPANHMFTVWSTF